MSCRVSEKHAGQDADILGLFFKGRSRLAVMRGKEQVNVSKDGVRLR